MGVRPTSGGNMLTMAGRIRMTLGVSALAVTLALAACGNSSKSATGTGTTAASGYTASAMTGSTIKVGLIASLTGPQASSSNQGLTVAPAWADWMNANGGIAGHPVRVCVDDDKNDPATAQADEQDLASKGVVAIIA